MMERRPLTPRPTPTGLRPAIWMAAVGSAMAGSVHGAAARNHEGDQLLTAMFVATAIVQVLLGLGLALRPRRPILLVAVVVNGGAVAVWALTRTVGIGAVDVLATVEDVGTQDLGAAIFALAAVLGATVALIRPAGATRLRMGWAAAAASLALVAALPAVAADHSHSHGDSRGAEHVNGDDEHAHAGDGDHHADGDEDHAHTDGEEHGDGDHAHGTVVGDHGAGDHGAGDHGSVAGDHGAGDHGAGDHGAGDHGAGDHGAGDHGTDPGAPGGGDHGHPADPGGGGDPDHPIDPGDGGGHDHPTEPPGAEDPITSLDDPRLTQAQWDAAVGLIATTTVGLRGFVTEADVVGAGYVSMGDGGSPGEYTHYVKWAYLSDPYVLDPAHVEAIVMKMNADGSTRVVAAMYVLSLGDTMWDAPDIAGELTTWHDHGQVCLDGTVLLAPTADGGCPAGVPYQAPPMLHVWVEANSCGPFTPAVNGGVECGAPHH